MVKYMHATELLEYEQHKKIKKICHYHLRKCLIKIRINKESGRITYSISGKYEKYWTDIFYYLIHKLRKLNYVVFFKAPNIILVQWPIDKRDSENKLTFLKNEHNITMKMLNNQ